MAITMSDRVFWTIVGLTLTVAGGVATYTYHEGYDSGQAGKTSIEDALKYKRDEVEGYEKANKLKLGELLPKIADAAGKLEQQVGRLIDYDVLKGENASLSARVIELEAKVHTQNQDLASATLQQQKLQEELKDAVAALASRIESNNFVLKLGESQYLLPSFNELLFGLRSIYSDSVQVALDGKVFDMLPGEGHSLSAHTMDCRIALTRKGLLDANFQFSCRVVNR